MLSIPRPLPPVPIDWPPSTDLDLSRLLQAHSDVRASGVSNACGIRFPVPTKLNLDAWFHLLRDYNDSKLCNLLAFGFPINYVKDVLPRVPWTNHGSALQYASHVDRYISKEVTKGAMLGPFNSNPLATDLVLSPLQTVDKKGSTDRRVVVDLSYPSHTSINAGIPKHEYMGEQTHLSYPSVDNLVQLVLQHGRGCKLMKVDLSRCYRQFYVDPGDYHLLGIQWRSKVWIDITLPFGLRSAALNAQRVSDAVRYLYRLLYQRDVINFLDDFGSAADPLDADLAFHQLCTLIQDILGLDIGPDKCISPTTCLPFLGIELDTVALVLRIPQSKIQAALSLLRGWISQRHASKRQLQSLLGTLIHISYCVKPGRRFVARIINLIKASHFPADLDFEFSLDIRWWLKFMEVYNGVSMIQDSPWSLPDAVMSTDACLSGCGGFYQGNYFHTPFPDAISQAGLDINELELMTLSVALKLWGHNFSRQRLVIACDNETAVTAVNTGRSTSETVQRILRDIWFMEAKFDFTVRAVHIRGVDNKLSDHLSRWELSAAHRTHFFELAQAEGHRLHECTVHLDLFN